MSNLHRIQWIDERIRAGKYPNCSGIARRFEISRRQASRDVEYLRYSLGAPVEYDPVRQGYFYSEDFSIPRERLKPDDYHLIAELESSYRSLGTARAGKLADLFARLYGSREEPSRPKKDVCGNTPIRAVFESAIREERGVHMRYRDAGNAETERDIDPLKVFEWNGNELVRAFCRLRQEEREFRLDRIREAKLINRKPGIPVPAGETGKTGVEEPERLPPVDTPASRDFGLRPHTARVRMNRYPRETVNIPFFRSENLFAWLIVRSDRFEIESPAWLKQKAARLFESLRNLHQ